MKHTTADKLGKQLLAITANLNAGKVDNEQDIGEIMDAAAQLSQEEIDRFNCYIKLSNQMELIYSRALEIYKSMLRRLIKVYEDTTKLRVLIASDLQRAQQPVIMTPTQYEAWKDTEPKTEAEQMERQRAELYGIAILEHTQGLCINAKGEYRQRNLLEPYAKSYGLEAYTGEKELQKDHILKKMVISVDLVKIANYNYLIERMAETLGVEAFTDWQIDISDALEGIEAYNGNICYLTKEQLMDEALQMTFTSKQREQLSALLKKELCIINPKIIAPQQTKKSAAALKQTLDTLPDFDIYAAFAFFTAFGEAPDLEKAAAEYYEEAE